MSTQQSFAAALLDPDSPCPAGLKTWNGSDPASRFAVYRNNLINSLIDALVDTYAVVHALVGDEFFRAMAHVYVQSSPPRSRILARYGEDFAAFLEGFEPASGLPYLADVARLEALRVRAYHAADTPALAAHEIAAALATPERLSALVIHLQPALGVLGSPFAVVSLWAAHQGVLAIEAVDPQQPEYALVLRPAMEVEVMRLPAGGARVIQCLRQGVPLGSAAAQAQTADPAFDLSAQLALLIRTGSITHLHPPLPATEGQPL
ncbi:MAG: DNA-binding domain-containing protein [Pseudomonas sp.]